MAWPTAVDVQARTDVTLTQQGEDGDYLTSYGLNVSEMILDAIASAGLECLRDPENLFTEATVIETHDGRGVLQLSHPPILSVTSLVDDGGNDIDEDDYIAYPRHIKILDDGSRFRMQTYAPARPVRDAYVLTYVGGYSDADGDHTPIPRALKAIILEMTCRELLRIDQKLRVYDNVPEVSIGSSKYRFTSDNSLLSDLFRRLRAADWTVIGI